MFGIKLIPNNWLCCCHELQTGLSCTKGEEMAYTHRQWITLFKSSVIPKIALTPPSSQTDFQNIDFKPQRSLFLWIPLVEHKLVLFFPPAFYCYSRGYLGVHQCAEGWERGAGIFSISQMHFSCFSQKLGLGWAESHRNSRGWIYFCQDMEVWRNHGRKF